MHGGSISDFCIKKKVYFLFDTEIRNVSSACATIYPSQRSWQKVKFTPQCALDFFRQVQKFSTSTISSLSFMLKNQKCKLCLRHYISEQTQLAKSIANTVV
jgi:hypothetical protein